MSTRKPRCRAQNHTGSGCDDPRCPERLYMQDQLQQAVATGSIEPLLKRGLKLSGPETGLREFFNELSLSARRTLRHEPSPEDAAVAPKLMGLSLRPSEMRYREQLVADLLRDAKLRLDPKTGGKRVSVYRSGVPVAPVERGVEADSYAAADRVAPAGRVGRSEGVFASASIDTGIRWLRGNTMTKMTDPNLRELTVDPDTTYIYSVSNWERASSAHGYNNAELAQEAMTRFWSESMTLTDWYTYVQTNPEIDTRDWEILVRETDIQQVKPVSWKRIIEASFRGETRELVDMQKRAAREQRWARQTQLAQR